jgi:hypothetical protein
MYRKVFFYFFVSLKLISFISLLKKEMALPYTPELSFPPLSIPPHVEIYSISNEPISNEPDLRNESRKGCMSCDDKTSQLQEFELCVCGLERALEKRANVIESLEKRLESSLRSDRRNKQHIEELELCVKELQKLLTEKNKTIQRLEKASILPDLSEQTFNIQRNTGIGALRLYTGKRTVFSNQKETLERVRRTGVGINLVVFEGKHKKF